MDQERFGIDQLLKRRKSGVFENGDTGKASVAILVFWNTLSSSPMASTATKSN